MIEKVHDHIIGELHQNTRTDIIFILAAIALNLLTLGINSAVAHEPRGSVVATIIMFTFISLSIVVNLVVILGLLKGKQTRFKLLNGLLKMYKDQGVGDYYDPSILSNYNVRYNLFILVVAFTGVIGIAIPLVIR
jgi:hypothetical protein